MSASLGTLQDTEKEGVNAAATFLASTPPLSEIISNSESELIPRQKHRSTIDSDPVPPRCLWLNESIIVETRHPSAQEHYQDQTDHQGEAPQASAFQMNPVNISLPSFRRLWLVKFTILTCFDTVTCIPAFHISWYHPITLLNFLVYTHSLSALS